MLVIKFVMILVYKRFGITPLQAINLLKEKRPELSSETLSYAGRLDPMAEGLLLILVGEENKNRRHYEHFDKQYEFEALVGISTDSYDLLGIPRTHGKIEFDQSKLNLFIEKNSSKIFQTYPPYSSIKVNGKPLYYWARKGVAVKTPKKEINIKKFELLSVSEISARGLYEKITSSVSQIEGDFRQDEILERWRLLMDSNTFEKFKVLKFCFVCTSGGYVRSLVNEMGEFLGTGAVTYSIKRTKIGDFDIDSAVKI